MLPGQESRPAPVAGPPDLASLIEAALRAPGLRLTALPAAALELLALARDPDADLPRVRALLETEPLIAAKVLGLAQSALYSRGAQILSLDDAILRLGLGQLSQLFLQASLDLALFRSERFGDDMDRLRRHSTATAHAARVVAARIGAPEDRAFLAGLLHDIGIAAALSVLDAEPAAAALPRAVIDPALRQVHELATDLLGARWELPGAIRWVAAHHHHVHVAGQVRPLQAMVATADWIAAELGHGVLDEVDPEPIRAAIVAFRFEPRDLEALLVRTGELLGRAG